MGRTVAERRAIGGARGGAARLLAALAAAAAPAAASPPEFAPAVAAAVKGDLATCQAEFERIGAAASQRGLARRAFYGGAVCAARGGRLDAAFALLERAIALDFHDEQRFYYDPRLAALRRDPRFVDLERKFVAARGRWRAALEPELVALVAEDERDRRPGAGEPDADHLARRDRERIEQAKAILAEGRAQTPDDLLNAAKLLGRSELPAELEEAHRLAAAAAEADADLPGARPLAAAALDRALVLAGRPQKYGTQSVRRDGRWVLAEVDPAVTDAERARWEVPSLAAARQRVEEMNARPGAAPAAAPEVPASPDPGSKGEPPPSA
jgi:hypothetical protein